ncbi:GHKL domain-containing protein [Bacillus sp. 31A1R]|uniref:GHKL domain-containing protein n=1 Tax=Robertmurraya mangrovi TaxID=3098077 RepID=A0ABU5J2S2_9BACI|nr:GHKL domain-containing protein [Bacillus sp. 31A1R]MDZ5473657.1 GHKL domain-containing protein [Bacillus sp. 31A1R]
MKQALTYWGMITALGIIHLQSLLTLLPWKIPIYLTSILVIAINYYFYKRILLQISSLGLKRNSLIFILQLILLLFYISDPSYLYILFNLFFIGFEWIRLDLGRRLGSYTSQLKQFEEQIVHFNETFLIVRSERHDFLKHISALHFLLEEGKDKEAKVYLDDLVESYEETNLSIKGESGIVAGMLNQMYRRAKASNISVVYDLDLPISTLPFTNKEFVGFLGNLLLNSIEACEEWQNHHKKQGLITLQFYKRGGLYLLTITNQCLPISSEVLDHLFEQYGLTTKSDGHEGLGTKQIHDIVKRYQGFIDFVYKDEEFTIKIKIPAIR